jgi:5-methylcytosine-specific restriction protein A
MPYKHAKPCAAQSCRELVREGRWCNAHRPVRHRPWDEDKRRGNAAERGYDSQWRDFSKHYLAAHPLCRWCEEDGRVTPAVLVDHIVPLDEGGAKYDPTNLQPLDRRCHGIKTAWDKRRAGRLPLRRGGG